MFYVLDSEASANAVLSIIHLLSNAHVDIKLEASRKVSQVISSIVFPKFIITIIYSLFVQLLSSLYAKPSAPRQYAQQLAWQEIIVRLLIVKMRYTPAPLRGRSLTGSMAPGTSRHKSMSFHEGDNDSGIGGTGVEIITSQEETDGGHNVEMPDNQQIPDDNQENNNINKQKRSLTLDLNAVPDNTEAVTPSSLTPQFPGASSGASMMMDSSDEMNLESDDHGVGDSASNHSQRTAASSIIEQAIIDQVSPENFTIDTDTVSEGAGGDGAHGDKDQQTSGGAGGAGGETEDEQLETAYVRYGGSVRREELDKEEELCQNVLLILFTIMWKGVEGYDDNSWKLRGQVKILSPLFYEYMDTVLSLFLVYLNIQIFIMKPWYAKEVVLVQKRLAWFHIIYDHIPPIDIPSSTKIIARLLKFFKTYRHEELKRLTI